MFSRFVRLQTLKILRSVSITRNLIAGIFMFLIVIVILGVILLLAFSLHQIITEGLEQDNALVFLNANLLYFFIFELLYRFFLQKLPVIDLENFLHLPIKKSTIVHFLLIRSLLTSLSAVVLIFFWPFALVEISTTFGTRAAYTWLAAIVLISLTIHWFILWYKQKFGDNFIASIILFVILTAGLGADYYGWFNTGGLLSPLFEATLQNTFPLIIMIGIFLTAYWHTYRFYKMNAYLEELSSGDKIRFVNRSIGFFSRLGMAGEMADTEWKLIMRHKKSRNFLFISVLFLLYGLLFYGNPGYMSEDGFSYIFIFTGIFITGIFILQYGQLFLSWNAGHFDFFLFRNNGIEALIRGKYLLLSAVSLVCFILSLPYVYFGWDILFIHTATFLFNMGITIHIVIYVAIWKPKPMDLGKGSIFNYEGMGFAQFLMAIPVLIIPYLIFLPIAIYLNDYIGLIALGAVGILGIIFSSKLSKACVNRVLKNRYEISSSFRQEI